MANAPAIVPSYLAKLGRAEQHIGELEREIASYAAGKPYTVCDAVKRKQKMRLLTFTADPANTDIPIIAAEVIYSIRSGLDHLMSALVPSSQRSKAMFPIYFQGVWEAGRPGENEQRAKERTRWASDTAKLPNDATTLLKRLQPAHTAGDEGEVNLLQALNRLANRDRHEKLPVVAAGLSGEVKLQWTGPDGIVHAWVKRDTGVFFKDGAYLEDIPDEAMNVEIEGTPAIGIRIAGKERHLELPTVAWEWLKLAKNLIVPGLSLHARP